MTASEPLKRKSEWRYDHLPRLAIYQDDVQALFDLFTSRFGNVDMTAGRYQLPDVASLSQFGRKPLHDFSVRGDLLGGAYGGWAAVTIAPMYVQIVVSDDQNVELLGIALAARTILTARTRRIQHFLISWAPTLVGVALIGLLVGAIVQTVTGEKPPQQVSALLLLSAVLLLVLSLIALRLRRGTHGTLYPFASSSQQSWWDRNRDPVMTGLIGAVIAGLILLAVELALGVLRLPGSSPGP